MVYWTIIQCGFNIAKLVLSAAVDNVCLFVKTGYQSYDSCFQQDNARCQG